jgi:glycosyltransferase involved in cell wall biosynthesis
VNDCPVLHVQKVAGISGSEAYLLQLLPDLRGRGWDVRFLMLHEDEPGAWEFARELTARGVPLDEIRLRADVDPIAFGEVVAYLAGARPTILHTHLVHADVYGQLAGSLARVPLRLSTKHGFNEFREGRWFGLADRSVGSLAHVHIAISQGLARYLAETEGFEEEAFEIVHYGIAAHDSVVPYARPEPRLLCIGRLIPIKGHLVLLRALAQARKAAPGVTLDLAGRGPLEPALKSYARELGLDGAVHFLGFVSPVGDAIENAAIVVVPSLGEGFGMVALEAMERGRPVVASAVGGLPEIVEDGRTGLVVATGDAGALAAALVDLASDPARAAAMGAAGRERAVTAFTQARCTDRTDALYRAALAEAPARRSRSSSQARSSANAASSASTKSHGTR